MKTIKMLRMRVIIGILYSVNICAEGNGWNFTYLAPSSYDNSGFYFKYYRGKSNQAYDSNKKVVPLLSQYGPVKADNLALSSRTDTGLLARSNDLSAAIYNILTTIANTNADDRSTFGQLLYDGEMSFNEIHFGLNFQINDNIHCVLELPVFSYKFTNKGFTDLTPATGNVVNAVGYNKNNADWKAFLDQYANILTGYGLKTDNYTRHGVGDLQCSIIFENVYRNDKVLAIDALLGIVLPTGKRERLDHIFSIDYGHKQQFGAQVGMTATSLVGECCELRAGGRVIFFAESTKVARMYTDEDQSSFIKLAQGRARHNIGTVYNGYATCQIFPKNKLVSALVGYSYNGQSNTFLYPEDTTLFRDYIVNNDPKLKRWYSHTLFTEISFFKEINTNSASWCEQCMVSFLFDHPFAGKNTVKGNRYGGSCGLVVKFDF